MSSAEPMDPDRWERIESVFQQALDTSGPARLAILQHECDGDAPLRQEVESLLQHYECAPGFIDTPAFLSTARRSATAVGHYRILEEIGGGGMGVVYKAEDTKLGRVVALKFLARYHSATADAREQFRREARTASALNHPNVCVIYDIEEDAGEQFIAMEFVEGRTLRELIAGKLLDTATVATLGSQIADALAAAHRKGIVHRDIKPANIVVSSTGLVKVLDFGVAKLLDLDRGSLAAGPVTETGPIAGTLPYMSPEQLRGVEVDSRADMFALGAVLYEMATGQQPFKSSTVPDLIDQILNRPPMAPPELNSPISMKLFGIIQRCLEKEPERRYPTADAVATELRRLSSPEVRRQRGASWWMTLTVALTSIGALAATWSLINRRAPQSPLPWEQLTDFPDSATSPALSNDGHTLAFIRGSSTFVGRGDVYIKKLPEGDPVRLTNDGRGKQDPIFSPDGARIVYSTGPLPYDVWSVPVSGGTPLMMMRNASTLTWTGGGRVMFGEVRDAPHMAIVTATEERDDVRDVYVPSRLSEMAHRAYLSPDGKRVLIAEMDTEGQGWLPCRVVPFDASSTGTQIGPPGAPCASAAWSPDGKWMYVSSAAGGNYHIWRQRFPRGEPEQVTSGPTQEEGIAMAPDGGSLVTSVGAAQSTLSLWDANGERKIDNEAAVSWARFSDDGRTLFYLLQKQMGELDRQSGELWAVDVATSRRERVLPGLHIVTYDISPDAAYIAATVLDDRGRSHLWLAPVDRHAPPAQVEWPTPVVEAIFDSAGGLFFLARDGPKDFVYHTDRNGANARKVVSDPIFAILAASPSGSWLLVRAQLPGREASSAGVVAYPVNGGDPVPVFDTIWPTARWTPDGKQFYTQLVDDTGAVAFASVAVSPGSELPSLPPGGLKSPGDAAHLPGVTTVRTTVSAGPDIVAVVVTADFSTTAIVRAAVHRNLYRVPLP